LFGRVTTAGYAGFVSSMTLLDMGLGLAASVATPFFIVVATALARAVLKTCSFSHATMVRDDSRRDLASNDDPI
jgi:hypothetical protein